MPASRQKYKNEKDEILPHLPRVCFDVRTAVEFFEAMRWPDGVGCPRCGDTHVAQMKNKEGTDRNARFLWRCYGCKKQFTVKVGTVMEDSPLPLTVWAFAFWQATASKKGVSAKQIQRQCRIGYEAALFVLHRVRWAMVDTDGKPLAGTVEVDETFVGGKPRKMSKQEREHRLAEDGELPHRPRGRGRNHHTPVVAAVERGTGRVRTRVVADVTALNLKDALRDMVHPAATLHTDELKAYRAVARDYAGHETVNHSVQEYARGDVHVNSAESFFSRLERSLFGIHHRVSREHLHRYCTHMEFLHNHRHETDGVRMVAAIQGADGKRLTKRRSA